MSHKKTGLAALTLGALGVVYGDIGTSPLYALNEIFFGHHKTEMTESNILGLISIVLWALILIIAIKYVTFVLRADNEGEGGVFALLALLRSHQKKVTIVFVTILTFAAGLLFGDGIITPAISVLSAVEGLKVAAPSLSSYVIPITIAIITGLFLIQSKGTSVIGKVFGPIIFVWFAAIATIGVSYIIKAPAILEAINPLHAIEFIRENKPYELLLVLGSVMLVVTGGEALYADMGHFGRTPIKLSWFSVVMPCLMLSYLGQGAFLLAGNEVVNNNIFYSLVPDSLLFPMIILATCATIIASQALISGAFSLASQGIALGLLPRLKIKYTHKHHEGQIYVPTINWALYVGCIILVLTFKSSSNLASAYGLAVSADMLITSLSVMLLAMYTWKWFMPKAILLFGAFAFIDLIFLSANSLKLFKGGWVPLTIGLFLFVIMSTWRWGKSHVRRVFLGHSSMTMERLLQMKKASKNSASSLLVLTMHNPTQLSEQVPPLVELFISKFKQIPKHLIILTIVQTRKPKERSDTRMQVSIFQNDAKLDSSLISIKAKFGFQEEPDVEKIIKIISERDDLTPNDNMEDWIVYVGRERVTIPKKTALNTVQRLRAKLYALMVRNSTPAYDYYGLGRDGRLSVEMVPVRIVE